MSTKTTSTRKSTANVSKSAVKSENPERVSGISPPPRPVRIILRLHRHHPKLVLQNVVLLSTVPLPVRAQLRNALLSTAPLRNEFPMSPPPRLDLSWRPLISPLLS